MTNPYQPPNKVSDIESAIERTSSATPYVFAMYGLAALSLIAFLRALGLAWKEVVGPEPPPEAGIYFVASAMLGIITEIVGFFFFVRRQVLGATIMHQVFAGLAMLIAALPLSVIIQGIVQELW